MKQQFERLELEAKQSYNQGKQKQSRATLLKMINETLNNLDGESQPKSILKDETKFKTIQKQPNKIKKLKFEMTTSQKNNNINKSEQKKILNEIDIVFSKLNNEIKQKSPKVSSFSEDYAQTLKIKPVQQPVKITQPLNIPNLRIQKLQRELQELILNNYFIPLNLQFYCDQVLTNQMYKNQISKLGPDKLLDQNCHHIIQQFEFTILPNFQFSKVSLKYQNPQLFQSIKINAVVQSKEKIEEIRGLIEKFQIARNQQLKDDMNYNKLKELQFRLLQKLFFSVIQLQIIYKKSVEQSIGEIQKIKSKEKLKIAILGFAFYKKKKQQKIEFLQLIQSHMNSVKLAQIFNIIKQVIQFKKEQKTKILQIILRQTFNKWKSYRFIFFITPTKKSYETSHFQTEEKFKLKTEMNNDFLTNQIQYQKLKEIKKELTLQKLSGNSKLDILKSALNKWKNAFIKSLLFKQFIVLKAQNKMRNIFQKISILTLNKEEIYSTYYDQKLLQIVFQAINNSRLEQVRQMEKIKLNKIFNRLKLYFHKKQLQRMALMLYRQNNKKKSFIALFKFTQKQKRRFQKKEASTLLKFYFKVWNKFTIKENATSSPAKTYNFVQKVNFLEIFYDR